MIESLQQFHFLRPLWLLLLPVVAAVWWYWRQADDPLAGWRKQMDPELVKALAVREGAGGDLKSRLLLVGWVLGVLALAGPTWKPEPSPFAEDEAALMVVLKAGESMDQPSPLPSRMERAQLKLRDLAEARANQPMGLIAYAGSAHLVLPVTKDTEVVATMGAEVSAEIMPEKGDRLDLALAMAGKFLEDTPQGGSILVIADAVDGDVEAAVSAHREAGGAEIQILAVNNEDSSERESIVSAGKALRASVVPLSPDGADLDQIVKQAARPPVSRGRMEDGGTRWQDAGWLFSPVLVLLVGYSFRREGVEKEVTV